MFEALKTHRTSRGDVSILDLFDGARAEAFSVRQDGLLFDYSKTQIDAVARDLLVKLTEDSGLASHRKAMFSGEKINETEGRAVLHTALRNLTGDPVLVGGVDVVQPVRAMLERMADFARGVRGSAITDVVNIGIGGSDLGPAMAALALSPYHDGPRCHFVSNVDGAHVAETLAGLDAKTTLVIVASKTFTTIETMTNAQTARDWMVAGGGDPGAQFAAVSTAEDKTAAFGIPAFRVFGFEDWVGGRYSMWGPIGLSLMIAIGPENFRDFLRGAEAMDRISARRRRWKTCRSCWRWWGCGTIRFVAMRPALFYLTINALAACLPICSSLRWRATASACRWMALIWRCILARWFGVSRAPTGSTHSIS